MKTIEERYMEWAGLYVASTSEYSLDSSCARTAFKAGYELAQKDLQQKLDTYIQLAETKGKELEEAKNEFKKCYKALEFFQQHADCRTNNTYHCNCNFCKDREHMELKRSARAYLEKWK